MYQMSSSLRLSYLLEHPQNMSQKPFKYVYTKGIQVFICAANQNHETRAVLNQENQFK